MDAQGDFLQINELASSGHSANLGLLLHDVPGLT